MNVAILYNLIRKELIKGGKPLDVLAELDSRETIAAEKKAFEDAGHKVILIEADKNAFLNLKKMSKKIDVVFNVAEGVHGMSTPRFQVVESASEKISKNLSYPIILKLVHEGSQMGLDKESVVENEHALRKKLKHLISVYKEPVLIEEFIEGREFTIPLVGNPPETLPIIEVVFEKDTRTDLWNPDDPVIPLLKKWGKRVKIGRANV